MLKQNDKEHLDEFIADSFSTGIFSRELRLNNTEMEYVRSKFPSAEVTRISNDSSSEKKWYKINIIASSSSYKELTKSMY